MIIKNTVLFLFIGLISFGRVTKLSSQVTTEMSNTENRKDSLIIDSLFHPTAETLNPIVTGANQTELYIPQLRNKKIAVVGNQTSVIFKGTQNNTYTHLVDSLLSRGVEIKKVFAPEHGFRGQKDASEFVADGKDIKTGVPIISLYSKNKKPTAETLTGIDLVIFDIQDVGVRFYTYISTLHYVMQACAENNIGLMILDRPNPNGHYIDGPTLEPEHSSFVGMHPIPTVHGMTIGEYAGMINGEHWLGNALQCEIQVIPMRNYTHTTIYSLPIRPSPNLPNDQSIALYPSLGFFEGTTINAGRGTEMQFQVFGSPGFPLELYDFAYTPEANFGAKYPKHQGEICYGKDLHAIESPKEINLQWLMEAYHRTKKKDSFFNTKSFTVHAGTEKLQQQIEQGLSFEEIKNTWQDDLKRFKEIRKKYLMYK